MLRKLPRFLPPLDISVYLCLFLRWARKGYDRDRVMVLLFITHSILTLNFKGPKLEVI